MKPMRIEWISRTACAAALGVAVGLAALSSAVTVDAQQELGATVQRPKRITILDGRRTLSALDFPALAPITDAVNKFRGNATLLLSNGTKVSLIVRQKIRSKRNEAIYSLRSMKRSRIRVKGKLKTRGTPEQVVRIRLVFRGPDGKKVVVKSATMASALTDATATSGQTVLVSFSEPVPAEAADASHFTIVPDPSVAEAEPVEVLAATLRPFGTQMLLTTLPLVAGLEYTLTMNAFVDPVASSQPFVFAGVPSVTDGASLPRVVGAASTSNTTVTVVFSKPMADGAEEPDSYVIVQQNVNPEVGALQVVGARFLASDRTAVELETRSQEELTYVVSVVDVTDLTGNRLAPRQIGANGVVIDPSAASFAGTPPGVDELVDSDGDGLDDRTEQRGWVVTVVLLDGTTARREVTSDPDAIDTDGDGVSDQLEHRRTTNPRSADTDRDTIPDADEIGVFFTNPVAQDTDGDGIEDGSELRRFKTHPVVADTDGDGFDDFREIFGLSRNPRVADLPRQRITVGEVRLQIDERFTFTNDEGRTVSQESNTRTTLSRSTTRTFERSDRRYFEGSASLSLEKTFSLKPSFKIGAKFGFKGSHTLQFTQGSTRAAQQAFEDSLTKGEQLTRSLSVTREVFGARIDADLSVENIGDVAFALQNLEVTVLAQDGEDRSQFLPVATLIPSSTLITGDPLVLNLGPLDPARGPIIFTSRDVFPNLVEDLMRAPRGMIFEVANFDITDEFGRNFAFTSQEVQDRTAEIVIDFGGNDVERFLVATSPAVDEQELVGGGLVGGIDSTGKPVGIPLDFALQDILGLRKNSTIEDGILAGANRVADSIADGDDLQLIPAGTTGLPQDAIVVAAGENGVLETTPESDDVASVTTGYATGPTCNADTGSAITEPETDGNGTGDTVASGDDVQVVAVGDPAGPGAVVIAAGPNGFIDTVRNGDDVLRGPGLLCESDADCAGGACDGPEALKRVGQRSSGEFRRFWALLVENDTQLGVDFGEVILRAGDAIGLAFVQDFDRDGLLARQEYLYGSSDSLQDTDGDGLEDFTEILVGWQVGVRGQPLRQVHPDPRFVDSDGDGLGDFEESDLRELGLDPSEFGFLPDEAVRTDPQRRDTDDDGVRDDEEVFGFLTGIGIVDPQNVIIVGADGIADTAACNRMCSGGPNDLAQCSGDEQCPDGACEAPTCDDVQVIDVGAGGFTPRTVAVAPGLNGTLETNPIADDEEIASGNEVAQTIAVGDDQQVAALGSVVGPGGVIAKPGLNGELDSAPAGDDVRLFGDAIALTNPLDQDTDIDEVPDGAERTLGSDPTDPTDAGAFADSDEDGLTDVEEKLSGWIVVVVDENGIPEPPRQVFSNPNVPDTDLDGLPDFVERSILTDPTSEDTDGDGLGDFDEFDEFDEFMDLNAFFPGFVLDGSESAQYGTDPTMQDTDGDGLADDFELFQGWSVVVPAEAAVREVRSDPARKDTDRDGLDDGNEARGADGELPFTADGGPNPLDAGDAVDPTDADTDGDGRLDGDELRGVCSGGSFNGQPCSSDSNCVVGTCLAGPDDEAPCTSDAECGMEMSCVGGANADAPCTTSSDCLSNGVCEDGGPNAGQMCATTARMPGEATLSAECGACADGSGPCVQDADCTPQQGTCVTTDAGAACTSSATCATGRCVGQCTGGANDGASCAQNGDCDSNVCDQSAGTCDPGNAGAACTGDSNCDSNDCRFLTIACEGPRCLLGENDSAPDCLPFGGTCVRDDATCLTQASDPLVPDLQVTVTYRSLVPTTRNDPDNPDDLRAGTFVWELDVRRPGQPAPGTRVSSSAEFARRGNPFLWCGSIPLKPLAPVFLNDSITFPMRKGEVFTLEGRIAQIGRAQLFGFDFFFFFHPIILPPQCRTFAAPPIASIPLGAVDCGIGFNEAFTFDQLSSGQTQIQKMQLRRNQGGGENCVMELVVDIEVD